MAYLDKDMVRIAYYYYKLGMTQSQIGNKMQMSRQRVNRLLKKALEENIVQINIVDFDKYNLELETKLEEKFNLKQIIVVSSIDEASIISNIALAGAEYLEEILTKNALIGVTLGKALSEVAKKLKINQSLNASTVQMIGGANIVYTDLKPDDITTTIARKLGGKSHILYAPAIVENEKTKDAMMSDYSFKLTFENMDRCNIIIAGIGEIKDKTSYYENKFDKEYKEHLLGLGAVGDIGLRWFDKEGNIVKHDYDNRTIGYNILKKKTDALVIGIAGGREKHEAILGALNGGFLDVLITDNKTAEYLISN